MTSERSADSRAPAADRFAAPAGEPALWQAEPQVVDAQRRCLRVLVIAQILAAFGTGVVPSIGVLLAEQVAGTATLAGIARTVSTLGAAAAGIPLAALAIRRGRRVALGWGWAIACLGTLILIASAIVVSLPLLIVGMLAIGVGLAASLQARFAATDLAVPTRVGWTLSAVVWSTALGAAIGPSVGEPGLPIARWLHLPPLTGGFVLAALALVAAVVVIVVWLRPDPRLLAAQKAPVGESADRPSWWRAIRLAWRTPTARLALVSLVLAHAAMVGVMTVTPVHLHHHGASIGIIGLTVSVHVLGMYAFAPVAGLLSDRFGPIVMLCIGQLVLVIAAVLAGFGSQSTLWVNVALFALGLGWSWATVPASTLLTEDLPPAAHPSVQGACDAAMNAAAAVAAGIGGPLLGLLGYAALASGAGLLVIPVVGLAIPLWLATRRRPVLDPR